MGNASCNRQDDPPIRGFASQHAYFEALEIDKTRAILFFMKHRNGRYCGSRCEAEFFEGNQYHSGEGIPFFISPPKKDDKKARELLFAHIDVSLRLKWNRNKLISGCLFSILFRLRHFLSSFSIVYLTEAAMRPLLKGSGTRMHTDSWLKHFQEWRNVQVIKGFREYVLAQTGIDILNRESYLKAMDKCHEIHLHLEEEKQKQEAQNTDENSQEDVIMLMDETEPRSDSVEPIEIEMETEMQSLPSAPSRLGGDISAEQDHGDDQ